jgi:hypothetical protein
MIQLSEVTLNLGFVSVKFKVDELDSSLKSIVDEMRTIASSLQPDEREKLRELMSKASGTLKVTDIYPHFQSGTPEHDTLRRLRDAQFIRPLERGRWRPDSHIEIKIFGKLMWEKVGEDKLFS